MRPEVRRPTGLTDPEAVVLSFHAPLVWTPEQGWHIPPTFDEEVAHAALQPLSALRRRATVRHHMPDIEEAFA